MSVSTVPFARRTRRTGPVAPEGEVALQEPPSVPERASGGMSALLMFLPMGMGSLAMMMVFLRPDSGMMAYLGAGMMVVSVVGMALTQILRTSTERKQRLHGDRRDYLRYLSQVRRKVRGSLAQQRRAARWLHPDPRALWSMALSSRLWERRSSHDDFGEVRFGLGVRQSVLRLLPPETKPVEELEPLAAHALRRFLRAYTTVVDAPIAVYLRGFAQVQLRGDSGVVRGLIRAVLAQAVTVHAPGDLRVVFCVDAAARPYWDWAKWLPHVQDEQVSDAAGPRRLFAGGLAELETLLGVSRLTDRPRFEPDAPVTASEPYVIVVCDGPQVPGDHALVNDGLRNTVLFDLSSVVAWQPRANALRLEVAEEQISAVSFDQVGKEQRQRLCRPDTLSVPAAGALARTLARYRIGQAIDNDEPLATDYDLGSLLGLGDLRVFDPGGYRRGRPAAQRLRVPIGIAASGVPIELDIKESAEGGMGPHGMLVGATGSGKSELLRTLVLALAARHSSEELNLVLVDFKGGAAFLGFDRLPHTSAVITNLADELELVDRMQDALTGELTRRQEHLRACGNYASRRDYERARSEGAPLEPMPSLFVVVDEFSEMLTSKPQFIDVFAMIGRLGRSLGVHLLLASQRLDEGRISQIQTHLSYRIGLRTFSAMESRSVLGVPDAYELPTAPGNGYLRSDTQTLTRFKGAYCSGPYQPPSPIRRATRAQTPLVPFGTTYLVPQQPAPNGAQAAGADGGAQAAGADGGAPAAGIDGGAGDPTAPLAGAVRPQPLADVVIRRLRGHGPGAHQVWLAPLKQAPTLDRLLPPLIEHPALGLRPQGELGTGTLAVPVGLIDVPGQQRREPLVAELAGSKGNVGVVGAPQSGRSTLLRSLICGLALTHTAQEVQFYCLDFGGGTLQALAGLPHVGSVANRLDRDRVTRTVLEVSNLMARREQLFADNMIDSMVNYRRARRQGAFADVDGYGDVFLVVDGWYTLRQDFGELEERFTEIAARGLGLGVHMVVATSRWSEMRPWLRDVLGTRFELRLGDPIESEVNSRFAATVPNLPGRGITADKLHFLTALPRVDGGRGTDDLAEATAELVEAVAVPAAPRAPRVRLLPATLLAHALPAAGAPAPGAEVWVPLGLDDVELAPLWHDFDASPHLLIFGDAETGKTNLLRHIARSVAHHHSGDEARVVFADFRREPYDAVGQAHQIVPPQPRTTPRSPAAFGMVG